MQILKAMSYMCCNEFVTKTEKAIQLISCDNWQAALSLIRTFRLGFTSDQKRLIQIASDVLNGHGKFYRDLGVDTDKVLADCKDMLREKYKVTGRVTASPQ